VRPHEAVLLALRTAEDAAHIVCSFSFAYSDLPKGSGLSYPRIDDLLSAVKKTQVLYESLDE
jgi:hypothetical protein